MEGETNHINKNLRFSFDIYGLTFTSKLKKKEKKIVGPSNFD